MKNKVTAKELHAALGRLLAEYAEIDEMLDGFMDSVDFHDAERKRQRANNRSRDRIQKLYERACARGVE